MPFTIGAFVTRLPAVSPSEFQEAYEAYVPYLRSTIGEEGSPESISRNYVRRVENEGEIVSFTDAEGSFGYDVVSYLNFRDEAHARAFQQAYGAKKQELGAKVAEFAELSQFRVIAFHDTILD